MSWFLFFVGSGYENGEVVFRDAGGGEWGGGSRGGSRFWRRGFFLLIGRGFGAVFATGIGTGLYVYAYIFIYIRCRSFR